MVKTEDYKSLALSYPEATEAPHFEKTSFRIRNKIFSTLDTEKNRIYVKLSDIDQNIFCASDPKTIYPVPNKWGLKGGTFVELSTVSPEMLRALLSAAYCLVAPTQLSEMVQKRESEL